MMKNALIITLGSRDLSVSKEDMIETFGEETQALFNEKGWVIPRLLTEYILEDDKRYSIVRKKLDIPIIAKCLDYFKVNQLSIDYLLFVTTNQPNTIPSKYRDNDTFYLGKIVQKLIKEAEYGKIKARSEVIEVNDNVAYLDSMIDFFEKSMKKKVWKEVDNFDKVYLLNQGGIDAINTGLLLTLLNFFDTKVIPLTVNEQIKRCVPLTFAEQYLSQGEKLKALSALKNYNYEVIRNININEAAKKLSSFLFFRTLFDFEGAVNALHSMPLEHRGLINSLALQIDEITSHDLQLVKEVYTNAKLKFKQEAYVDFLLRMFRVSEGIAQIKVFKHLDFSFNHETWRADFDIFLNKAENEPLKTFLSTCRLENSGSLICLDKPTIPVYIAILGFFEPTLSDALKKISLLSQLRNKSIGAHDFKPVSLRLIETKLSSHQTSIGEIFSLLDDIIGDNMSHYDTLNTRIRTLLT